MPCSAGGVARQLVTGHELEKCVTARHQTRLPFQGKGQPEAAAGADDELGSARRTGMVMTTVDQNTIARVRPL